MKTCAPAGLPARLPLLLSLAALLAVPLRAGQMYVTVTVDASVQGAAYPSNFTGLSVEKGALKPNNGTTGYMFDSDPTRSPKSGQVVQLVQNMGLTHLRIGGGTGDTLKYGTDYSTTGIDALFGFAQQTGLGILYSLRLQGTTTYDPEVDSASEAAYVWNNYQTYLDFFAIGNEPNYHSYHTYTGHTVDPEIYEATSGQPGTAYPSFVHNADGEWKEFAAAIAAGVTGTPIFAGPDTGDEGTNTTTWWFNGTSDVSWTQAFAEDVVSANITAPVGVATTHWYIGGGPSGLTQLQATTNMLSKSWVDTTYPTEFSLITGPVATAGMNYRFTECNDYLGNVSPASSTFAGALWALDFMYYQAAQNSHCAGVDFHNKMGIYPATLYRDASGDYHAYPKSAAIKMFQLGGRGNALPGITVQRSNTANVNAYATGTATDMWVTVINKTSQYVGDWTAAVTTVVPQNFTVANAYYLEMNSYPVDKDPTATEALVGGSSVNNNGGAWSGAWTSLPVSSNQVTVTVHSATAGLVHLTTY